MVCMSGLFMYPYKLIVRVELIEYFKIEQI